MPKPIPDPQPLGIVSVTKGPYACDGQECYEVQVNCQQISRSEGAIIKVGERTSQSDKGTILFFTGWIGDYYWEDAVETAVTNRLIDIEDHNRVSAVNNNNEILNNLRMNGFRTVQLKWDRNWFEAEPGKVEGMARLACKPASAAKWVFDNIHKQNENQPYCATGHSNGASQVSYSLSHYGLVNLFRTVVLEGGPNMSYVEHACIHDNQDFQDIHADQDERNTFDWSFGFPNDGSGPCAQKNIAYQDDFKEASLISYKGDYFFPETSIIFIIGGDDTTTTAAQGAYFYKKLEQMGTPNTSWEEIPGAPHFVTSTTEGAQAMQQALLINCQ